MTDKTYYVRELPYDIQTVLDGDESLLVTVDTRLAVAGIRFENSTGYPLTLSTNPPLPSVAGTFVESGVSTRSFPPGVYNLKLTGNTSGIGPVVLHLSEIDLPDTSSEMTPKGDVGASQAFGEASLGLVDNFTTATVLPVADGTRFRLLGWRVQMWWTCAPGAANGTSRYRALLRTPGPQAWGDLRGVVRTLTTSTEGYNDGVDSGYVPLPGQGEVAPDGFDLNLEIEHTTIAGTAPNNSRLIAVAAANVVVEPTL